MCLLSTSQNSFWQLKETNPSELAGSVDVILGILCWVVVLLSNVTATVTFHVQLAVPVFVGAAILFIPVFT